MNKIALNIALVVLLSGCMNRTDSKGQKVGSNAPIFITPNANVIPVNKPKVNEVAPNKPAQVTFNAENYVMVKEKDLNMLVTQKTNETLLNIKKSNANAPQPNKELNEAIDNQIKKSVQPPSDNLAANVIQLAPVASPEKLSSSNAVHPVFAFVLVALSMLGFILTAGYFFFIKKKASHENPTSTTTAAPAASPIPPKMATKTSADASANTSTKAPAED